MAGGLSYFEEGGTAETPETPTEDTSGAGVVTGKGKKQTVANEGVLAAMADLYNQKQAQSRGFMEGMKDAAAWWSGGVEGPSRALAMRDEERRKQTAELFNMQNQIAAQKMAIENRDKFFGTTPTATTGTTPPAGGASTADASAGAAQLNQQTGGLLDLVQDPALKKQIGAQYLIDPPKAMGQLNAYLSKRAEEPAIKKEIDYLISRGMPESQALVTAFTKVVGSGALVPHDVRTPTGTQQTTPLGAASSVVGGPAKTSITSPAAPSTTANAPSGATGQTAATTTPVAPAAPAAAPSAPAQKAPTATAQKPPAATTTTTPPANFQFKPTGFAPGSKEDLEAKKIQFENANKGAGSESEGRGKTDYTNAETLEAAGKAASDNLPKYEAIKNILHETPRAVGIAYRSGPGSAAIQFVEGGASIPFAGSLKIPGMEEAVARGTLTQKELDNRATFNGLVGQLAMQYKKDVNKGMGSQSDADAKAAETAFGLSNKNPAKANLIFAVLQMEKEKLAQDRYKGWIDYQKNEKAAGRMPEYRNYENSDYYQKTTREQFDKRIREQLPSLFKSEKKTETAPSKTKSGATHSGW